MRQWSAAALLLIAATTLAAPPAFACTGFCAIEWGDDRLASVTAALRERFGLDLAPGRLDMQALIIDRVRPDATMFVLAQAGRVTRGGPAFLRRPLTALLTLN